MSLGTIFYRAPEAALFIFFSYLYTFKNRGQWALAAPLLGGGLNRFFLIAGITGYSVILPYIAFGALTARNLIGDMRDAGKDATENFKTIPVTLGLKTNIPHIHLIAVLATTTLWWSFTSLPLTVLLIAMIFQITTYNLTPR